MSTELAREERIIYMKSGLPHFVETERVAPLEKLLESGSGHRFVKLPNGQVINTAEIEGIYTIERYAELQKIKEGYRCCEYGKWHARKEECQCRRERWEKHQEELKRIARENEEKPPTPEEQARNLEAFTIGNERKALEGSPLFSSMYAKDNSRGRKIRRSTVKAWEKEQGKKADITNLAIDEKA